MDHLSNGRLNVGVGSGWMPEEFAAASASHIFPKRHKHVRETIEIMQGIWTNDLFEYHGEFADFERCGFGAKPVQKPHPPIFFSGLKDPKRSANRIAKYDLSGWIGIQDTPDEIQKWRGAIQRELEELGSSRSVDDLEICSMLWFVITDEEMDQTPAGKGTNLMVGNAGADHRHAQALQGGRADDAAALAAVPGRAGGEDARRPQASEGGDHAQGRRNVSRPRGVATSPSTKLIMDELNKTNGREFQGFKGRYGRYHHIAQSGRVCVRILAKAAAQVGAT